MRENPVNDVKKTKKTNRIFTIARWHTPTGDLIEGIGLTPDMIVPLDSSNTEDIQLDAAIEIIIDAISSEQSRLRQ